LDEAQNRSTFWRNQMLIITLNVPFPRSPCFFFWLLLGTPIQDENEKKRAIPQVRRNLQ